MFGKKKNKKDKNLNSSQEVQDSGLVEQNEDVLDLLGEKKEEKPNEPELTESQKQKQEQLDSVKSKISRILKSGNIEIVDENAGDEYDTEETSDSEKKKQADYDSLKAVFGGKDKNKKQELTLTIDDFDYTYVGKYLEEYDLIHKKNIKKIKLPSKALKIVRRVAIVLVLIGALVGGVIFAINFTKEPVYYLDNVALSQESQTYYVEEDFDFTGLYLYLTYTNGKNSYTKTTPLNISHFLQSYSRGGINAGRSTITFKGGSEAVLGFGYGGKICTLQIKIKKKEESSLTVKYTNGLFDLETGSMITSRNLFALINFTEETDYNSEMINLKDLSIYVNSTKLTYSHTSDNEGFVVNQNLTHSSVITVSYETFTVNLTYVDGSTTINEVTSQVAEIEND